ncbi:hypothetical protein [Nocardia sp. NPDC127526]|uniref:hypothetical protein n=1 Tax=Nocardia sp. NPDC127526 TaxID=3345393 RepID=UPI00362B4A35
MSTPTIAELETVIAWLEKHAENDRTGVLKEHLTTAKADLSHVRAGEERDFTFARAYYETVSNRLLPWETEARRPWETLPVADRRYQLSRAKPLLDALEKAGWTKPKPKARTWDDLADVPADVVVVDREGDKWENRGGKWGLGTGGNWGLSHLVDSYNYGPFREYLG